MRSTRRDNGFPPDDLRCVAETRSGVRCSRNASADDLCPQHNGEVEVQRLFTGCAVEARLRVVDRSARKEAE